MKYVVCYSSHPEPLPPPELTEQQKALVDQFQKRMVYELIENRGKGDFTRVNIVQAMEELRVHVKKLEDAVGRNESDKIKEHSADVANATLFVWMQYVR